MLRLSFVLFLIGFDVSLGAGDATEPLVQEFAEETVCHPPPTEEEISRILPNMHGCGPFALAAGVAITMKAAPVTTAAVIKSTGKVGARALGAANLFGLAYSGFEIFKLFGRGATSVEKCRVDGIEFKQFIIEEVNRRGEKLKTALEDAGFQLSERDIRRLQFPPAYSDPERIKKMLCGEMVLLGEKIKERQNRVYGDNVNGTMKTVPFPEEDERMLSESDKTLIEEFRESLKCLPPEQFAKGICAIGQFALYAKALPEIIKFNKPYTKTPKLTPQQKSRLNRYSDLIPDNIKDSKIVQKTILDLEDSGVSRQAIRRSLTRMKCER